MKAYTVRVHAIPGNKAIFEGERPKGYYQRIGVTIRKKSDLVEYIRGFVGEDTGGTVIDIDDIAVADLDGDDQDIRDVCDDITKLGVWYASGMAFYYDDDKGEE
jgi:hypothetical protein